MNKNICDIKELSQYLKISIPEIRKLVREKKIPNFRLGNRIKFDLNKIDKWLEDLEKKANTSSLFY